MPDRFLLTLRQEHARLRALLRAFLKILGDEHRPYRSRDLSRMRELLFRIRQELAPDALAPLGGGLPEPARAALATAAASAVRRGDLLALEHLQDLGHALAAFEVLGEDQRAPLRLHALLFVEWQLAQMDRVERDAQARENAAGQAQAARFALASSAAAAAVSTRHLGSFEPVRHGLLCPDVGRPAGIMSKPPLPSRWAVTG